MINKLESDDDMKLSLNYQKVLELRKEVCELLEELKACFNGYYQ